MSEDDSRMSFVTVSSEIMSLNRENSNLYPNLESKVRSSNKDINEYIQSNNNFNTDPKDKFEDLPLQFNSIEKIKKSIIPYLLVEDKGEKKDYLGSYKYYEISEINEKAEKRILCYRRYDNFDVFYNKLKRKYPCFLIPKLIGKNTLSKIIHVDNEFFNKRRRQLNFFLNCLYNHHVFGVSKEFTKFINDPEFDDTYFKVEDKILYHFPESSKISESLGNKIYGVFSNFSNYFKTNDTLVEQSEDEKKIKKMEIFYKKLLEIFRENKNNLTNYIFNIKKTSENFSELSNNFFYLKDVIYENPNTKEYFYKYYEACNELVKINIKHFEDNGIKLEDKFEGFLSILSGLCEIFDRYTEFLKSYITVHRALAESKLSPRLYDNNKITQEFRTVEQMKRDFEKEIFNEVKNFVEKYSKEYSDILENYKLLIRSINTNEWNKLQNYTPYFK